MASSYETIGGFEGGFLYLSYFFPTPTGVLFEESKAKKCHLSIFFFFNFLVSNGIFILIAKMFVPCLISYL